VLAVIGAFWPVVKCGFVNYDDDKHILGNPRFNPPNLSNTLGYWTERGYFGLYIPVTYTAWTLVAQVARRGNTPNPAVFHAANLLIHIGSAIVVYLILRRLIRSSPWPALIGALLFAVHPVQVEPVAWISGFRDVFGGLLALSSILLYIRFLDARQTGARRGSLLIASSVFALALLSKPAAVVVPLILLIIDLMLYRRPWRAALVCLAPLLVMSILVAAWARFAQPSVLLSNPTTIARRPLIAADSITFYLCKLVWPANLAPDQGRHDYGGILTLAPLVLLILLLLLRRQTPMILAGYLIFLAGLLPVLGFVPFDFQEISNVADRYLYLPILGISLAAAAVVARFDGIAGRAAACAVLVALGTRTWHQTWTWRDSSTLFNHVLSVNPKSFLAYNNLGAGEVDPIAAEKLLRRSVELKPDYADARITLGSILAGQGRLPEAVDEFLIATKLRPDIADGHANLGLAYAQLGRYDDAIAAYRASLAADPGDERSKRMIKRLEEMQSKLR
jgi:hypothetical protein